MKYLIIYLFCIAGCYELTVAQNANSVDNLRLTVPEDMLHLKVKGLKKEQVYSATRSLENALNSPISVTLISREMIDKSGVLTIPEALRLAPEMLVMQKTNGNYSVHIRGKQPPLSKHLQDAHNKHLLVVVNHTPMYDYLFGGIIWESLPVSLPDILRIEVVRTPAVVLWGQAAITGVIHIFTKSAKSDDLTLQLNAQNGSTGYNIRQGSNALFSAYQASVRFGTSDKLRFRLSGNYLLLSRFQDEYYLLGSQRYTRSDSLLFFKRNAYETNINTQLGQKQFGGSLDTYYQPSEHTMVASRLSFQQAQAQVVQADDTLALVQRQTNAYSLNIDAYTHGFRLFTNYTLGSQNYAMGYTGNSFGIQNFQTLLMKGFRYGFFEVMPGVGMSQAVHKGDTSLVYTNYQFLLKSEARPLPWLRLLVAGRADLFKHISRPFISFQANTSIKLQKHFFRLGFAYNETVPLLRQDYLRVQHSLLPDLSSNKTQSLEAGWGTKIAGKIRVSLDAFYTSNRRVVQLFESSNPTSQVHQYIQTGVTTNASIWFSKVQLGGFITIQRSGQSVAELSNESFDNTPTFYGGFHCNYTGFLRRLNININGYFYGKHISNTIYGIGDQTAKVLLNTKVAYKVWLDNLLFINVRNTLNQTSREFVYADVTPITFMLGAKITL